MEKYDLIVVGAGNGGLMAAAYGSKMGLKTLILEKHNLPGGSATSFRRGRFEFESSLHEMCQLGTERNPGAAWYFFTEIGARVKWLHENKVFRTITQTESESYDAVLPSGIEEFCDEVERQVPGSRKSVRLYFEYAEKAVKSVDILVSKKIKPENIPDLINLIKLVSNPSDKFMDLLGIPEKAQHILTTYWPYMGESTDTLNAFTMAMINYLYVFYGAGIPSKFSHEISLSLDEVIRRNGGEIRYNCEVTKILVKNKAVYGVQAGDEVFLSDHVICNCFPNTVFGKMMDPSEVPAFEKQKINARKIALSFVGVYLGLNKSASELGIKDYTTFIQEAPDSKTQFEKCHGLGGDGLIIVNCLNIVSPGCTPEGTCQLSFTSPVYDEEWAKIAPKEYKKKKIEIAKKMIEKYEKTLGITIQPYIEEIEIATPVTFARYLNTPDGTPYGYQFSNWDGMFPRTVMSEKELTIKGLRFCGAHTDKGLGYNVTYSSGIDAAKKTYNDIKAGK